ncbi:MAG: hypothetical protein RI974_487, partial [Actinomycetota bacterium]
MDLTQLNYLAILVAALVANVIGAVWFSPKAFFPVWWKLIGRTPEQQPGSSNMAYVFGMTFLGVLGYTFGLALVLEVITVAQGSLDVVTGAGIGALLGLLIGGGASLSHRMFAGQGFKVWALEVGNDVVALAAVGAIL